MRPTAKRVVLELLSASALHEVPAATLVEAAALLGVGESNVRVTLARLVASGTLEVGGRGLYRLGRQAQALTRQIAGWRELEGQVCGWGGAWACVHAGAAADRGAQRRSARALRLLGFRAFGKGLEVRPDNLEGGVAALRERLVALAAPSGPGELVAFRATEFDAHADAHARSLWRGERLSASYVHTRERVERWLVAAADLDPRRAAREAFFFGGDVVRQILFDPRLPEPLVDVASRRAMVAAACELDAYGRRLWGRLFGLSHGPPVHGGDHDRRWLS